VLASTKDRRRAEIAAACLVAGGGVRPAGTVGTAPVRADAVGPLAKALLDATDGDRAWLLRSVLRPSAEHIPAQTRAAMLEAAMRRLADGQPIWEPLIAAVRDVDPGVAAESLRALAGKLSRKNPEGAIAALRALCRSEASTDEDRYALATALLPAAPHDTRASARAADESLRLLGALADKGADVADRLRKDRSVALEQLYYLGFHFAEQDGPVGAELLRTVVERGGRAKIAKMARSKLALARAQETRSA